MGNSSALLALPWQSLSAPAQPHSDSTSLPEELAAVNYWLGLGQRTNVKEHLWAGSVCILRTVLVLLKWRYSAVLLLL